MSSSSEITNVSFWEKYWKNKTKLTEGIVSKNYLFYDILNQYVPPIKNFTFLEIGGYPGYFSIFMTKYLDAKSTLIDRYIDNESISKLIKSNNISNNEKIETIECDLFQHNIKTQYDVVMSTGFIEHFKDTSDVIDRHLSFVKPKGVLILTVPNFLGLNGYLQKIADWDNYDMHNISTMSKPKMLDILNSKQVKIKYMSYYGYFGLWLEKLEKRPLWLRLSLRIVGKLGRIFVRFESKIFSPHFVIVLEKK